MSVFKFLNDSRNSVVREKMANYRFFYEVKLSAARCCQDIQISLPEIDKEGYDVVLDDEDQIRVFQIRTTLSQSSTSRWKVQKQLLRPDFHNAEMLQFELSPEGVGHQGAIVLIEIEATEHAITSFNYYYCDIYTLKAFEYGLISKRSYSSNQSVLNVIKKLQRGNRYEKVELPQSAFLKVSDIDKLLALANLSSKADNHWRGSFQCYIKNQQPQNERPRLLNLLRQLISDPSVRIQ